MTQPLLRYAAERPPASARRRGEKQQAASMKVRSNGSRLMRSDFMHSSDIADVVHATPQRCRFADTPAEMRADMPCAAA